MRKRKADTEPALTADIDTAEAMAAELQQLRAWSDALLSPIQTAGAALDMQKEGDKTLLARAIWLCGYSKSRELLRGANRELVHVIESQVQSTQTPWAQTGRRLVNGGILLCIMRAQARWRPKPQCHTVSCAARERAQLAVPLVLTSTGLLVRRWFVARRAHLERVPPYFQFVLSRDAAVKGM